MRAGRGIVRLARVRAKARRMNEGDAVVRHALEVGGGGGEFHDTSGGHELRWQDEHGGLIGFQIPDREPSY